MRIDAGLISGLMLEFVIMLYYANTTLKPKRNYYISAAIGFVGYLIIFGLSLFNWVLINISTFLVVNSLIFIMGYKIDYAVAVFKVFVMTTFMFLGETAITFVLGLGLDAYTSESLTPEKSMLVTAGGKFLYFIAILIIKKVENRIAKKYDYKGIATSENSSLILVAMPIVTFVCIAIVYPLNLDGRIFFSIFILAVTVNIVVFAVNEIMLSKNMKIRILEKENYQNRVELEEYKTIGEKYEHSRIMNHDFREHLNVLKTLISEDIQKAQEYVGKIEKECEDSKIEKYSDNNILNILLIRKKKECEENGIKLNITSTNPKLDFIDGMDTVAIFSNLINNAIEACSNSARKDIFIDLYTVNNAFSVIKVENYADKEPIVVEGMLRSGKDDGNSHGIGIKSINNSLSKYDGKMSWSYDKAKGMFRTVISINNSQINI